MWPYPLYQNFLLGQGWTADNDCVRCYRIWRIYWRQYWRRSDMIFCNVWLFLVWQRLVLCACDQGQIARRYPGHPSLVLGDGGKGSVGLAAANVCALSLVGRGWPSFCVAWPVFICWGSGSGGNVARSGAWRGWLAFGRLLLEYVALVWHDCCSSMYCFSVSASC